MCETMRPTMCITSVSVVEGLLRLLFIETDVRTLLRLLDIYQKFYEKRVSFFFFNRMTLYKKGEGIFHFERKPSLVIYENDCYLRLARQ